MLYIFAQFFVCLLNIFINFMLPLPVCLPVTNPPAMSKMAWLSSGIRDKNEKKFWKTAARVANWQPLGKQTDSHWESKLTATVKTNWQPLGKRTDSHWENKLTATGKADWQPLGKQTDSHWDSKLTTSGKAKLTATMRANWQPLAKQTGSHQREYCQPLE